MVKGRPLRGGPGLDSSPKPCVAKASTDTGSASLTTVAKRKETTGSGGSLKQRKCELWSVSRETE